MCANRWNLRVFKEIGVEEHDGDVRFFTGSGSTAVSRMRNASGHNYWNSSFIMDVAMGQIPRSTERISSLKTNLLVGLLALAARDVDVKRMKWNCWQCYKWALMQLYSVCWDCQSVELIVTDHSCLVTRNVGLDSELGIASVCWLSCKVHEPVVWYVTWLWHTAVCAV